ncbi:MAG TPA: SGNH/GDSL hydrolase family protein [Steroidobacteraceae bacterium]|nr:SGNH/GDSL hydrolase family protein [Steroidobacteraceae bacterium]
MKRTSARGLLSSKLVVPLAWVLLLGLTGNPAGAAWLGTWGAAPQPPGGFGPPTASFSNQTIRQIVRLSAGGDRVRIRFTNEYGTKPLLIGAASVARVTASGAVEPGSERRILFGGKPSVIIPAGAPWVSDSVDLPVSALSSLSISIYLPEDTGPCTCHAVGMQTAEISPAGDYTTRRFEPQRTVQARAFLSGIEAERHGATHAIVVLGDSISDGVGSTLNANRRWPDLLAQRLAARKGAESWGVVNMGISGNRVLDDGAGVSALARLDRDVLSVPGVSHLIVFEGVNDLGLSYGHPQGPMAAFFRTLVPAHPATAERVIAGYRQIIERAHAHGIKVLGATIAPYQGAVYYSPEGEAQRAAINQWIRTSGAFDGVLDFDAVLRDPHDPTQMASALQAGDHLHGSDAGYEALANSIDLQLFR